MSDAKKILARKGKEAARAGRLFLDAICGEGPDLRTKIAAEAARERAPAAPALVLDAELLDDEDEDDDAVTVRDPPRRD